MDNITRVRFNKSTGSWEVHIKEMVYIGKLDWVILAKDFITERSAKNFMDTYNG